MLRKSSKCEKRNRFHNGVFDGENVIDSENSTSSIYYVSNFNKIPFKTTLIITIFANFYHRDTLINVYRYLYSLRKPVFRYSSLALLSSNQASSKHSITNIVAIFVNVIKSVKAKYNVKTKLNVYLKPNPKLFVNVIKSVKANYNVKTKSNIYLKLNSILKVMSFVSETYININCESNRTKSIPKPKPKSNRSRREQTLLCTFLLQHIRVEYPFEHLTRTSSSSPINQYNTYLKPNINGFTTLFHIRLGDDDPTETTTTVGRYFLSVRCGRPQIPRLQNDKHKQLGHVPAADRSTSVREPPRIRESQKSQENHEIRIKLKKLSVRASKRLIIVKEEIMHIYSCYFQFYQYNLSVASVAKARSCLSYPSIITSNDYHPINHSSLWSLRLSFNPLELKLRSSRTSFSTQALPARVSKHFFSYVTFKIYFSKSINVTLKIYYVSYVTFKTYFSKSINVTLIIYYLKSIKVVKIDKVHSIGLMKTVEICRIQYRTKKALFKKNFKLKCINTKHTAGWMIFLILRSGDVEMNPGPLDLTLISLNCRGLKKEQKFKQLLTRIHMTHHSNVIAALQETHLEINNLNYTWKGKHIFTEGSGSKGGIITLLSDNMLVKEQSNLGQEAQISLIEVLDQRDKHEIILVNLHSPCPHNQDKIIFYSEIKSEVDKLLAKYDDAKVIMMGDYNTTFNDSERLGTNRSRSEKIIASKINQIMEEIQLRDCWDDTSKNTMTWRHGDKMSRLDRIQWSRELDLDLLKLETDWTYTQSDHCAVIAKLGKISKKRFDKIVRIDTFFMNNVILKHKFLSELSIKMGQTVDTNMNPHQKLEYLKMTIRSTALEIASNYKKERNREMDDLRRDIEFWQSSFENAKDEMFKSFARSKVDEAICKRDKILDNIGEFICNRLKSKWYQEGERGTKYFLNMQKSRGNKLELRSLMKDNNELTNDPLEIDKMVEEFYRKLYEKGDSKAGKERGLMNFLNKLEKPDPLCIENINTPLNLLDLKSTLDSCSDSSPGPDGIPYSIIKLTWTYFGPILLDSWNFAVSTGSLTHSHESSYLKLLPKEGKDLSLLKNWRPITLSNCDFKIITKSLAIKLSKNLNNVICQFQTAYMKNRQITDNLHILQYVAEKSNTPDIASMIVSLDAEKAFDSVEHWYIKEILNRLNLGSFIGIFELLYRKQQVSIHLNNRIAGNYTIKNGVKQGDALSCILFILAVEPLLRNINSDVSIKGITIHGAPIPKAIAYADDVACIIHPSNENLQKIFDHYQIMSSLSGLNLNADKSEIITSDVSRLEYELEYNGKKFSLSRSDSIKINGIYIGYNVEQARIKNYNKIASALENQLNTWSKRYLTILGKIQIFKTFGLSQILYAGSTIMLSKSEESQLNNLIYKFIWNRNMDGNRAPDRIKRSILSTKVKNLGFGMVDFRDVIMSIRVKNVLRLLNNPTQPMGNIIRNNITSSTIKVNNLQKIRPTIDVALSKIREMWSRTIKEHLVEGSVTNTLLDIILNEFVGNVVYPRFRNKRLTVSHKHDHLSEIFSENREHPILKKIDKNLFALLKLAPVDYLPTVVSDKYIKFPINMKLKNSTQISSREIRLMIQKVTPISCKMIMDPDTYVIQNLGNHISKLTNVRLKTTLLRAIHGDVYCGTRLKKFGMSDTDACPRCDSPETISHQLAECMYVKNIWQIVSTLTGINTINLNQVLGHDPTHDKITLTLHAEIIRQLMSIDRPTIDPMKLIKSTIKRLSIVEKGITKYQINNMLNSIASLT